MPSDAWMVCAQQEPRRLGTNSWIPTSGRRLVITGGRFPTLAFQLGDRTQVVVARLLHTLSCTFVTVFDNMIALEFCVYYLI